MPNFQNIEGFWVFRCLVPTVRPQTCVTCVEDSVEAMADLKACRNSWLGLRFFNLAGSKLGLNSSLIVFTNQQKDHKAITLSSILRFWMCPLVLSEATQLYPECQ